MKMLAMLAVTLLVSAAAVAQTRPFNLSLTPDIAVYDRGDTIHGVTLSIWGENPQASFALGIVNGTVGDSAGLSLGIMNYAENYKGLQCGLVNQVEKDFYGWQGGFIFGIPGSLMNFTGGNMQGLQTGVVNYAARLEGVQIGLVNYVDVADPGVQVGLVNIIHANHGWFTEMPDALAPGMVLVNWRF